MFARRTAKPTCGLARQAARPTTARRLFFESLEDRRLLAAVYPLQADSLPLLAEGEDSGSCSAFVKVDQVQLASLVPPVMEVTFSADMEIEPMIDNGSILNAVQLIHYETGSVTLAATEFAYDSGSRTLSWSSVNPLPAGYYELRLDGMQLHACAGTLLQGGDAGLLFELPVFAAADNVVTPTAALQVDSYSVPSLVDWDSDNLLDLVVGEKTNAGVGKIRIYLNEGTAQSPVYSTYAYAQQAGSDLAVPASGCLGVSPRVADWDGDGKKDLIVGRADGQIVVYLNTNTDAQPAFGDPSPVVVGPPGAQSEFNVGARATVEVVDWNNDGRIDLVVGSLDGKVRLLLNESDAGPPDFQTTVFVQEGTSDLTDLEGRSSVAVADLDGDGRKDLILGNTAGQLHFYRNIGTDREPVFDGTMAISADTQPVDLDGTPRSRPFVGDFNADGRIDVLVGAADGLVRLYEASDWITPVDHPGTTGLPGQTYSFSFKMPDCSWHNATTPFDANHDGAVTIQDVQDLFEELNNPKFHDSSGRLLPQLPTGEDILYCDVHPDGLFIPRDILLVINHLHDAAGEGEPASLPPLTPLPWIQPDHPRASLAESVFHSPMSAADSSIDLDIPVGVKPVTGPPSGRDAADPGQPLEDLELVGDAAAIDPLRGELRIADD